MSLDQKSWLSEWTGFPAECGVFNVYLHVTVGTLQSAVESHFMLRMVGIFKVFTAVLWPGFREEICKPLLDAQAPPKVCVVIGVPKTIGVQLIILDICMWRGQ